LSILLFVLLLFLKVHKKYTKNLMPNLYAETPILTIYPIPKRMIDRHDAKNNNKKRILAAPTVYGIAMLWADKDRKAVLFRTI